MLIDTLRLQNIDILGITNPRPPAMTGIFHGMPYLGTDDVVSVYPKDEVTLVNAIGSTGPVELRADLYNLFTELGYQFLDLIHPSAIISAGQVNHGDGVQVLPGAIINAETTLGDNVLIGSRVVIEHECRIGDHSHVASGAVICDNCNIGSRVHIGAGATINPDISIGDGAVIASGAVVVENVPANTQVAGVPAQIQHVL